ncbi:MAG: 3-deoxy-D-manno-octulosonic acid transferase [Deltaproteobacteria bacterium]|nr:3-deoxy-D-manno-octulosonic acid transferase [Deltaproteobacteria bacterium]
MSPAYLLYNLLGSLAAPLVLGGAAVRGRLKGHWLDRLGFVPEICATGRPRIWIHAVSVGEVQVAAALIKSIKTLQPHACPWVTTTTDTGREFGRKILLDCPVLTFPLDVYGGPARALARWRPDIVIILETELWPNFLKAAKAAGVKTILANGRISERSISGYRKVRFFIKEVLSYLDLMAMIRPEDRERIISMGADPARVQVVGNAKYDLLFSRLDDDRVAAIRQETGLTVDTPVLVAGSTREGEEIQVLHAFQRLKVRFPDLRLVIAPRHIQRAPQIETLIRDQGLTVIRRSNYFAPPKPEASLPDVILVDVMGELFYWYGLSSVTFCGGSLVPLGGQNPLEPAVWGKPVLYGPSMTDFIDATELLESAGAGRMVAGAEELYRSALSLLVDRDQAALQGQAGRQALSRHQGAAHHLAKLALGLSEDR